MKLMQAAKGFFLTTAVLNLFIFGLQGQVLGAEPQPDIKKIYLSTSNWEGHGGSIEISGDGSLVEKSSVFGTEKIERAGQAQEKAFKELKILITEADIFSINDKYSGPHKTTRSWTNVTLVIETGAGTKTIVYHSEDDTVPDKLKTIVDKIDNMPI